MDKNEYKKLILLEIKRFINKKIETKKIYKELQQIKNNITYLKKKYGQDNTEEFETEKGTLSIIKYKTKFSTMLRKEFKELSSEEKRKLYKTGLLTILFRLNYRKFEKIKKENQVTELDDFVIERKDIQPYRWNLKLNENSQNELNNYEKEIKEYFDLKKQDDEEKVETQLDKLEKERALMIEQLEEIEEYSDEITPDVYDAITKDLVEMEIEEEENN